MSGSDRPPFYGRSERLTARGSWWSVAGSTVLPLAAAIALFAGRAVTNQLPVASMVQSMTMILLTQVFVGALIWRVVRPRDGWLIEDLAAGFAIGSALAVLTQIVAGFAQQRWLAVAIPLGVAVALLAAPPTRARIVSARWSPVPWWLPATAAALTLAAWTEFSDFLRVNQLVWSKPGTPHVDAYLHVALGGELLNRGPSGWPMVQGEELGYHWFAHSWIAQVAASSGVGLDEVVLRIMPALAPIIVTLSVAAAGLRLRSAKVGALAVVLVMVSAPVWSMGMPSTRVLALSPLPLTPMSPTLASGVPTLLTLVVIMVLRWRGKVGAAAYGLVPVLAMVAAGTKGSTVPLVIAGLGLALVACALWNRRLVKQVATDFVVVSVCLVLVMVVVFRGSSAGLKLDLVASSEQSLIGRLLEATDPPTSVIVFAMLVGFIWGISKAGGALLLAAFPSTRRDPMSWLLLGGCLAGAGAITVFAHPGLSQYYFVLTAYPLAALGSALGLAALHDHARESEWWGLVCVGVAGGVAMYAAPVLIFGPGQSLVEYRLLVWVGLLCVVVAGVVGVVVVPRWRVRSAVIAVGLSLLVASVVSGSPLGRFTPRTVEPAASTKAALATSQGQLDAARYIRDHSGADDVVMTNRHCVTPRKPQGGCDSRRWVVTAFTERQVLVEGWTATPRATREAPDGRDSITVPYWRPEILELNDTFYVAPTAEAQRRLWDLGVRWIYVENTMPHAESLEPFATRRYANADASAWQLNRPSS